ncbi:hypothetical protein HDU81_005300 [Chytriomyces hyalinus]|nr:hypothetical protein HDU81_005300 [Chytriomyces hyalinus]
MQRFYNAAKVVSQQQQKRRHSRGAAPGIEPGWLIEAGGVVASDGTHCEISLIDYNHDSISAVVLNPQSLEAALKMPRPAHSSVRWINVSGFTTEVLRVLAVCFELHPLSVEDVMHPPQRIKADFYQQHIYISMIVPLLKQHAQSTPATPGEKLGPCLFSGHSEMLQQTTKLSAPEFEQLPRPDASLDECSIFLLPGNMVLSMFECSGRHITDKICEILHGSPATHPATPPVSTQFSGSRHKAQPLSTALADIKRTSNPSRLTQLRKLGDASLLAHALVDGIVDSYFEVVEFYEQQISLLQDWVLVKPKSAYIKTLYLMQKEIALIQRKLLPTESLIMHLRDADPLRSSGGSVRSGGGSQENRHDIVITEVSKLYFRDVLDHCMTVLEELSAIDTTASGLIDLTFNTISFQTNESMKLLAVMSAIFLPITFVAGYFGMNFTYFPELSIDIGVFYFWIWIVILCVITVLATARMGLLKKWD